MYICDWSCRVDDTAAEVAGEEFPLNVLEITQSGHLNYRPM
jgi:hypothetical protein